MYVFNTIKEVREITEEWLPDYNELRPHEPLGNLTPKEFAGAAAPPSRPPKAGKELNAMITTDTGIGGS